MHPTIHVNWLAVLVAVVASFFFGWLWYGPLFGKTPKGMLIFTADGHFTQIHVGDVPWIASNNRLTGTVDEYKGIMLGSLSLFGTYAVDEEKKTVTFRIVSGTFPNLAGDSQTRTIDRLTADEFVNTNPSVAGGRGSASNFYKRAK